MLIIFCRVPIKDALQTLAGPITFFFNGRREGAVGYLFLTSDGNCTRSKNGPGGESG